MLAGFQNPHAAEKVFDNCRTAAEEYAQACQEFLDGQCAQLLSAWGRTAMPEAGDGKGKPANPRAQQEARARLNDAPPSAMEL